MEFVCMELDGAMAIVPIWRDWLYIWLYTSDGTWPIIWFMVALFIKLG